MQIMVQYGIWAFDEKLGLIGRPENLPELYISVDKIWDIEETSTGRAWKWPLHFAPNRWFTPRVADDFNKAFFYAHQFFKGFRPAGSPEDFEIDVRTIGIQTEILSDYFPGPDGEMEIRA